MSLLTTQTALNPGADYFLKAGDAVVVESVAAPAGDPLTLQGVDGKLVVGADAVASGAAIAWNTIDAGAGAVEIIAGKGLGSGFIDFYPGIADGVVPTDNDRAFRIADTGVIANAIYMSSINDSILGASGWSNLQPGAIPTASVTGPGFAYATIPSIGSSNIPVVPGGVYSISGGVALNNNVGGSYTLTAALNNGGNDSLIQRLSADQAHTGIGNFAGVSLNFNTTFVPVTSNVQLYLTVPSGAPGDVSSVDFAPLYLTRIR